MSEFNLFILLLLNVFSFTILAILTYAVCVEAKQNRLTSFTVAVWIAAIIGMTASWWLFELLKWPLCG